MQPCVRMHPLLPELGSASLVVVEAHSKSCRTIQEQSHYAVSMTLQTYDADTNFNPKILRLQSSVQKCASEADCCGACSKINIAHLESNGVFVRNCITFVESMRSSK